ncbi:MAG: hypothetical protein AAGG55_00505 [Pseudomonadota bacterium]
MRFVPSNGDAVRSENASSGFYCTFDVIGEPGQIAFQFSWSVEAGPAPVVGGFNPLCEYGPKVFKGIGSTEVYVGGGVRGKKATVRVLPIGAISLKWDEVESAVADVAEYTLDSIRPLAATCDGYIADAEEQKEMRRRGTATSDVSAQDAPVIDVNNIPDPPYSNSKPPADVAPECKMVAVDNSSTLFGSGGVGGGSGEQCLCGLEIADPSRCR